MLVPIGAVLISGVFAGGLGENRRKRLEQLYAEEAELEIYDDEDAVTNEDEAATADIPEAAANDTASTDEEQID